MRQIQTYIKRSLAALTTIALSMSCFHIDSFALGSETAKTPIVVVSLGDSYSSGEGNKPFYNQDLPWNEKVKDQDWLAHRSENSWPGQLVIDGKTLKDYRVKEYDPDKSINWFFSASSGAETIDMSEELYIPYLKCLLEFNHKEAGKRADEGPHGQRKQICYPTGENKQYPDGHYESIMYEGYEDLPYQLDVFKDNNLKGKVDYVTMTLGGNDAGFVDIVEAALKNHLPGILYFINLGALDDKLTLAEYKWDRNEIGIRARLKETYRKIKECAGKQANIIVAGYPQLLYESPGFFFDLGECKQINDKVCDFNNWIEKLVDECNKEFYGNEDHIFFADVLKEFDPKGKYGNGEHGAYASDAWIKKIMVPQDQDIDQNSISSAYSMHPNEEGVAAYARCVQKKIDEIKGRFGPATSVSLGYNSSGFINEDGTLYSFGVKNQNLGIIQETPRKTFLNVKQVAYGSNYSAVITENGDLYTCGDNWSGRLGTGDTNNRNDYEKIQMNEKVKSVSLGYGHSACITEDGKLYMWGNNAHGELGTGDSVSYNKPVQIMKGKKVKEVSLGEIHSACITEDNKLYVWGSNISGGLGTGDNTYRDTPTQILKDEKIASVSLGGYHSACITESGRLYMWGNDQFGQLGSSSNNINTPVEVFKSVEELKSVRFKKVALGDYHSACISRNGDLYIWGNNSSGQLGNGKTENQTEPKKVYFSEKIIDVSLGSSHSACITENGNLYTWGDNSYGQLGIGYANSSDHTKPICLTEQTTNTTQITTQTKNAAPQTVNTHIFTGLTANTIYNVYAMKNKASGLTPDNLMYINQYTTDGTGGLNFKYGLKEDTEVEWLAVPMESDKAAAELKVKPAFDPKEDKLFTDIKVTVEGKEFTADSDGIIALTGLADGEYSATVTKPNYAPRKVNITIGDTNDDIIICKYGDCNGDGDINFFDLGLMQQKLCDWDVDYIYPETADTNGDGATDFMDLGTLQRYLCDWDITLGKAS